MDGSGARRQTGSEGRVRCDPLIPGDWSVEAAAGEETAKIESIDLVAGAEHQVDLLLGVGNRLIVTVTSPTGAPVSDAMIQVTSQGEQHAVEFGLTFGSGRAEIDVNPGPALVEVEHARWVDRTLEMEIAPGVNELDVALEAGAAVSGAVLSTDGAPIPLANVELHPAEALEDDAGRWLHPPSVTVTDRDGRFRVTGVDPGSHVLLANKPGYGEGGPERPIEVGRRAVDGVEVLLEPGASLIGTVTGLPPSGVARVAISVSRGLRSRRTAPDTSGRFVLEHLAPGEWTVSARRGSRSAREVERTVTIRSGQEEVFVELHFEEGLVMSGQVLAGGQPAAGGSVTAQRQGAEPRRTATDQQGRFELDGLEAGTWRLGFRQRNGAAEWRVTELLSDQRDLRIDLLPTVTLEGVVLDAVTRRPVSDVFLTAGDAASIAALTNEPRTNRNILTTFGSGSSTATGQFRIEVGAGAEVLWVRRDGYEGVQVPLSLAPGQVQAGLLVELNRTARAP